MRLFILVCSLLAAACTIQEKAGETHTEFNPPLVEREWGLNNITAPDGMPQCELRAHSLGVLVRADGVSTVAFTGVMDSGDEWSLTIGSQVWRTRTHYLRGSDSEAAIARLNEGGTAYTELARHERLRNMNLVRYGDKILLADFPKLYRECRRDLKHN